MDPTPAEAALLAKKKKKAVKMALGDFQASSWADSEDSGPAPAPMADPLADLPKAPVRDDRFDAPRDYRMDQRDYPSRDYPSRDYPSRDYPSRDSSSRDSLPRAPRSDVSDEALSKVSGPPFKMFIGNLSFSVTDADIYDFFGDLNVANVRIIMDRETGRPKGFAYAEFATRDDLKQALARHGSNLVGRSLNLDLASERQEAPRRSGFGGSSFESRGETASTWRREAPMEPAAPSRGFRRDEPREGGFRRDEPREGGFRRDDRQYSSSSSSSSSGERPRLELKPRSADAAPDAASSTTSSQSKPRSNPFGNAKPRDELEAQRRIEERRKAAEAAKATETGKTAAAEPKQEEAK